MNGFIIIPIVVLIVGAMIALGFLSYMQAKKRREELQNLATQIGWTFDPSHNSWSPEELSYFDFFHRGHGRAMYNTLTGRVMIGELACPAMMGDYTYKVTSGSGKNRRTRTYHFSYLLMHTPIAGGPGLLIRREGLFDKLAGFMGFDDIDFESEEFSRKFLVKSSNKRFAYDVIHPRMMEFLLTSNPTGIDIQHDRCCVSDGSTRWTADEFRSKLSWIDTFFEMWPEHLDVRLDG